MSHPVRERRPALPTDFVAGNVYDKYRTGNPLHRALMKRFLACARELAAGAGPRRVLEVGCGPGDLAGRLFGSASGNDGRAVDYVGTDASPQEVAKAQASYPGLSFSTASAYELPFDDGSFDLVVACEILEHLDDPDRCLRELQRVSSGHLLVSVPWEPVWRLMNLARGAYLARWGDTPGHLQHFSRRRLRRLVSSRFDLVAERHPFPWTMLLAQKRGQTPLQL